MLLLVFLFLGLTHAVTVVPGGDECLRMQMTGAEFYTAYGSVFRMSDGSTVQLPQETNLQEVQTLLEKVQISVAQASNGSMDVKVCGNNLIRIMLLAVAGNFVTNPGDEVSATSAYATPSIIVDSGSGRLAVHMPYDAVRGYFVEALLIISIIVIARLAFIRNVTYTIKK